MNEAGFQRDFATAVRWRRGQLRISQEKLAERAGLHRTYVSDIERGARNLSLASIDKLARALGISVSALFWSSEPHPEQRSDVSLPAPAQDFADVLLVEDNPDEAELTLSALKEARLANPVRVFYDGEEALNYVFCRGPFRQQGLERQPEVILLDLSLPELSGLEVLRHIKARKETRGIPVVVLAASGKDHDIAECQRLGAETCIVKPVDVPRLIETVPQLGLDWALFKLPPALRL